MAATPDNHTNEDADALQSLEERILRAVDLACAIPERERRRCEGE